MAIYLPTRSTSKAAPVSSKPAISENAAIKRLDAIAQEIAEARKTHADTQALYTERKQLMDYVWS